MDGFGTNTNVIVIAATNRADVLDMSRTSALLVAAITITFVLVPKPSISVKS